MLKTYDMLTRLIDLKVNADQMNTEYVDYLISLTDLYVAVQSITVDEYQEIRVRLDGILNPVV